MSNVQRDHTRKHASTRGRYTVDCSTEDFDAMPFSPLLSRQKPNLEAKDGVHSPPHLFFYSLLLFPTQRVVARSSWPLTKLNPQCLLSALSPTYALSISPSPVAIIHQIRNGVEKTARRIVDPLNTRGGGGMYRRARQL